MMQYLRYVIPGLLTLFVGGTVLAINWNKLRKLVYGKRIAVIGERGVGKTHLIKFLSTGSIPDDYNQTLYPEKYQGRRFELKDLNLKLSEMFDVSGGEDQMKVWKDQFDRADLVFYLFHADRLSQGTINTQKRVQQDIEQIQLWLSEDDAPEREKVFSFLSSKNDRMIFAIGTHLDLDPEYSKIEPARRGDFHDTFKKLPAIQMISNVVGAEKIILGSMENERNTEELVHRLFKVIQDYYGK